MYLTRKTPPILTTSAKCFFVLMQLILLQPHFNIVSFRCTKIDVLPHRNDQFRQRNGKNETQYKGQRYFHPSNNHSLAPSMHIKYECNFYHEKRAQCSTFVYNYYFMISTNTRTHTHTHTHLTN